MSEESTEHVTVKACEVRKGDVVARGNGWPDGTVSNITPMKGYARANYPGVSLHFEGGGRVEYPDGRAKVKVVRAREGEFPVTCTWESVQPGDWVEYDVTTKPRFVLKVEDVQSEMKCELYVGFATGAHRFSAHEGVKVWAKTPELLKQPIEDWNALQFDWVFPEGIPGYTWEVVEEQRELDPIAFLAARRSLKNLIGFSEIASNDDLELLEVPEVRRQIQKSWNNLKQLMDQFGMD